MTEAEWLACEDPLAMVFSTGVWDSRKTDLLVCACYRRLWDDLPEPVRVYVNGFEAWCAGQGDEPPNEEYSAMEEALSALVTGGHWVASRQLHRGRWEEQRLVATPGGAETGPTALQGRVYALLDIVERGWQLADPEPGPPGWVSERSAQALIVRDIFGNPFKPTARDAASLTPTVGSLAQSAFEERLMPSGELDTQRLAVLADALEEAGCADPELLGHLRSEGPHVRGCWALDLILGKG